MAPSRVATFLLRLARSERLPWALAGVAILLTLPMIGAGYVMDDKLHAFVLRGGSFHGGPHGPWDLYRFSDGGPELKRAIEDGLFPWWTSPRLKLSFFRPLPSLWRALDHALWGDDARMPHVETSLAFAALVFLTAQLYRRMLTPRESTSRDLPAGLAAAGLAATMFAVDDAHNMVVTWIANRYALPAATFGFAALYVQMGPTGAAPSWRRALSSAGLFALALACGETATGMLGYLAAHAYFTARREGRDLGARVRALAPHGVVTVVWVAVYKALGYGGGGSNFYVDPVADPGGFAKALVERLPRLVLGQLFLPPAETWALLPTAHRAAYVAAALLAAASFVALVLYAARGHEATKMLAWGALLSVLPTCATLENDRLLLIPGLGAFGVVAIGLERALSRTLPSGAGRPTRWAMLGLGVLHLALAPLLLVGRSLNFVQTFQGFVTRGAKSLPAPDPSGDRVTFILGTPDVLVTNYMALEAAPPQARSLPRGFILTSQDRGTAVVERVADDAYEIRNDAGENTGVFATVFVDKPFAVGDKWENDVMKAEVLAVGADGFPRSIRFRFADIRSARWVVWQGRGFVEVPLLEPGEQRSFPSTPLLEAMQP